MAMRFIRGILLGACLGSTGCTSLLLSQAHSYPRQQVDFVSLRGLELTSPGHYAACITLRGRDEGHEQIDVLYHLVARDSSASLQVLVPDPAVPAMPCRQSRAVSDSYLTSGNTISIPFAVSATEREYGCYPGDLDGLLASLPPVGEPARGSWFRPRTAAPGRELPGDWHYRATVCGHVLPGVVLGHDAAAPRHTLVVIDETGPYQYGHRGKRWLYPLLPASVVIDGAVVVGLFVMLVFAL